MYGVKYSFILIIYYAINFMHYEGIGFYPFSKLYDWINL